MSDLYRPTPLPPEIPKERHGAQYVTHWTYTDLDANKKIHHVGFVVQYRTPDGQLSTVPFFKRDGSSFTLGAPDGASPLYGLHRIKSRQKEPLWIVGSERSAEEIIILGGIATTCQGLCNFLDMNKNAIGKTDWSPLQSRRVIYLWPDNHQVGFEIGKQFKAVLSQLYPKKTLKTIDVSKMDLTPESNVSDYLNAHPQTKLEDLAKLPIVGQKVKAEQKPKREPQDWESGLKHTDKGKIKSCLGNTAIILRQHPRWKGLLGYNSRTLQAGWVKSPPWNPNSKDPYPRNISDEDAVFASEWLIRYLEYEANTKNIMDSFDAIAMENKFDPIQRYFQALKWDSVPRIDEWLINFAGAEDNEYNRVIFSKWLLSAVARTYEPGCQVDTTLILEGPQGIGKSSFLRALAGDEYFSDHIEDLGNKDSRLQLHGPLIIELSELDALGRRDISTINNFLVIRSDQFRPPYGYVTKKFKRTCIFAGTTNSTVYLRDETGARRFWPIRVKNIDIKAVQEFRDQLWAEAVHRYKQKEIWYLDQDGERLARDEQEARRNVDSWEVLINDFLLNSKTAHDHTMNEKYESRFNADGIRLWVTIDELLEHCLNKSKDKWEVRDNMRIGRCLAGLGWIKKRFRDEKTGARPYHYQPPRDFYFNLTVIKPEPDRDGYQTVYTDKDDF